MLTEQENCSGYIDLNLIYRLKEKNAISKEDLKELFLKNSFFADPLPEDGKSLSPTGVQIPDFALFFLFFVSLFL